jgi:thiol-disulfide isomerase/thioredoxin
VEPIHPYSKIAPGHWKAVLYLDAHLAVKPGINVRKTEGMELHASNSTGELPFNFEVIYDNDSTWHIVLINGEERLVERNVSMGRSRGTANDTIRIDFTLFDTHLHAVVKEDIMQGYWYVHSKENYRIPFTAYHGQKDRFVKNIDKPATTDFGGKWEVTFEPGKEDEYKAIGEFFQRDGRLSGTFMTETGDYRFQEGIVEENKLWLSSFDGTHAFLFNAKMMDDGSLSGIFRSGKHYTSNWIAKKNEEFQLTSPDSMSVKTKDMFSIQLPNTEGEMTTFPEPPNGRIKVLQVSGTWCPNCMDETNFLVDYLSQNKDLPLDVVGIFFERYADEEKALPILKNYARELNITYPILFGGKAGRERTSEVLTMIDQLRSYPTMIILDKQNKVRRVHTGFAGPATSEFTRFSKDFDQFVRELIAE